MLLPPSVVRLINDSHAIASFIAVTVEVQVRSKVVPPHGVIGGIDEVVVVVFVGKAGGCKPHIRNEDIHVVTCAVVEGRHFQQERQVERAGDARLQWAKVQSMVIEICVRGRDRRKGLIRDDHALAFDRKMQRRKV